MKAGDTASGERTVHQRIYIALRRVATTASSFGRRVNAGFDGRRDWLIPAIISLVPWIWLLPVTTYLYAQDSLGFINPFGASNSPLLQYNPLFSWTFPVSAEQPNFFAQTLNLGLAQILPVVGLRERVLITVGVLIAAFGTWLLLRRFLSINGLPEDGFRWLRTLATAFYIMNPFTLSVVWWHFEGWCYFYIFLPYLIWFLLGATYQTKLDVRDVAIVVVMGVCLAPGLASGFAVSVTFGIVVFLGVILVRPSVNYGGWRGKASRIAVVLSTGPLLVAWTVVPYVLVPHAAFTSSNYVNPANLVSSFRGQSETSTLWNVVTFSAVSWVSTTPGAYGIPRIESVLLVEGVLAFLLVTAGATLIRAWKGLGVLYVLALSSIALSSGANPPFGPIDAELLSFHGPFLLLVNGYYFLCEYYALLATILVLVMPIHFVRHTKASRTTVRSGVAGGLPDGLGNSPWSPGPHPTDARQTASRQSTVLTPDTILTTLGVMLVGVLLVASIAPFASGRIFQASGSNVNEFNLPSSFDELSSTLHKDGVGPSYFTLVLPMSSELGVPLSFGSNADFLDTTNLISSYIPGPVIQANTGAAAADMMSFLASCTPCDNLTLLFDQLHIAWVVWDPYVEQSAYLTRAAPSGQRMDFPMLRESLNASFGPPQESGPFSVYSVEGAVPILTLNHGLNVVEAPGRLDYYNFVNSLGNASMPFQTGVGESVWTNTALGVIPGITSLVLFPFDGGNLTLPAWAVPIAKVLNSTDSITPISDWDQWIHGSQDGSAVELASPLLQSLANGSNLSTNMTRSGSGYSSPGGSVSHLNFNPTLSGEISVVMDLTLEPGASSATWFNIVLTDNRLSVVVQLFTPSSDSNSTLSVSARWDGTPFCWHNVLAPNLYGKDLQNVTISIKSSSAGASVVDSKGNASATVYFGSLQNDSTNPGFDDSAAPPGEPTLGTYTLDFQSVYPGLNLSNLSVFAPLSIKDVFASEGSIGPTAVPSAVTEGPDGDWSIHTTTPVASGQYELVLAVAPSGLWSAISSGANAESQNIASDSSVFAISLVGPPRNISAVVHFGIYLNDGLYVAIGEVLLLPIAAVLLRRRWR